MLEANEQFHKGISYTHSQISTPTLLTLPSATSASKTHASLRSLSILHSNALLVLSISSYTLAYALSPPRGGRHPYLLWTSLLAAIGWGTGQLLEYQLASASANAHANTAARAGEDEDYVDATHSSANILTPTSAASDNGDGAGGFGLHDDGPSAAGPKVNGEQVRMGIERFGFVEGVKAAVTGAAFFMGVVGIWGDGVGGARS